jgi:hypothetical protein
MLQTLTQAFRLWRARCGLLGIACLATACAHSDQPIPARGADPHYTEAGFFDMHVCHWPDRPVFFMFVFSTTRYQEVARVSVFYPSGEPLADLDLERYRIIHKPGKPEKRVFITQLPLPAGAPDGWYRADIALKNGQTYQARDRVAVNVLPLATRQSPPNSNAEIPLPTALRWQPVPGATHYQVYIRDIWNGGQEIFSSKVLSTPQLALPPDLLKPGGYYRWRVNARDVHEHPELGDFNHGSLSEEVEFVIAE